MNQSTSGAALLERMQNQIENWEESDDGRSVFLQCYRLMTINMLKAIEDDRFRDRTWITELLHRFAEYYFEALEAYDADDRNPSQIWLYVHDATTKRNLHVLQRLLLGINAHINYDLVLTLVEVLAKDVDAQKEGKPEDRFADHCLVNEIIAESIDAVQDDVVEKHDPVMDIIDKAFGRMDEKMLSQLIRSWRNEVWREAMEMLHCQCDEDREACRCDLEKKVLKKGRVIALDL